MTVNGRTQAFLRLCRPQFLVPGLLLYVLGFMLAGMGEAPFDTGRFALGYLVFFLAHFSLTFSNDYFDREADAFNKPTSFSGGSGALNLYPDLARTALLVSWALISLSIIVAVGFQLLYRPAWYFLPLVLLGNLAGYYYTSPPLKLAYRGLGELTTMVAAGLLMPGMGYLCAKGAWDLTFLQLTPAFLAYGAFFILSVEMPDVEADRVGGKRNLLVLYGLGPGMKAAFISVAMGALFWALLWAFRPQDALDYGLLLLFSLIPLLAGLAGLRKEAGEVHKVVSQVKINFGSLVAFLLLLDTYLVLSW